MGQCLQASRSLTREFWGGRPLYRAISSVHIHIHTYLTHATDRHTCQQMPRRTGNCNPLCTLVAPPQARRTATSEERQGVSSKPFWDERGWPCECRQQVPPPMATHNPADPPQECFLRRILFEAPPPPPPPPFHTGIHTRRHDMTANSMGLVDSTSSPHTHAHATLAGSAVPTWKGCAGAGALS
jgi:hypothetical protein